MYDILIVGSGPAGLTASIYAARANKKVALLSGSLVGGQLVTTTEIENFPGFANKITGTELMVGMLEQAKNLGVEIIYSNLLDFEKKDSIFYVQTDCINIESKVLIIATGASPRFLGIEDKFFGKGVSTCATCDGAFFKNKTIAVVGGGNSAIEEALYLSNIASKLYLIHRKKNFRAEKIMQDRLFKKAEETNKIIFYTPYEVQSFIGDQQLSAIKVKNLETENFDILTLDAVFIAVGHTPNTSFLKGKIELLETGYVKNGIHTELPGLFVAGDVFDSKYRQAITSAGFGCMAALEAIEFLG